MGPIGFVTPTKDMAVRPGQYVSGEGRIYHPYLAGWRDDVSIIARIPGHKAQTTRGLGGDI